MATQKLRSGGLVSSQTSGIARQTTAEEPDVLVVHRIQQQQNRARKFAKSAKEVIHATWQGKPHQPPCIGDSTTHPQDASQRPVASWQL